MGGGPVPSFGSLIRNLKGSASLGKFCKGAFFFRVLEFL